MDGILWKHKDTSFKWSAYGSPFIGAFGVLLILNTHILLGITLLLFNVLEFQQLRQFNATLSQEIIDVPLY